MLLPGQTLGQFKLHSLLGRGGMAEVWAADHSVLGHRVALKILMGDHPHRVRRLVREGQAQAQLSHPNLLPVLDVLFFEQLTALVLPLISGPSLDRLLQRYLPKRQEGEALLRGIVAGLDYAHEQGIVHRDLKPSNVLLDPSHGSWTPRLADFGLVKGTDEQGITQEGLALGTLAYAAPEQLMNGAAADRRADWFALGVVTTEVLTGQLPFQATTLRDRLAATDRPPRLVGLEPPWEEALRSLLSPRPTDRERGYRELRALLEVSASAGGSPPLGPESPFSRAAAAFLPPPREEGPALRRGQSVTVPPVKAPARPTAAPPTLPLPAEAVRGSPTTLPGHNLPPERDPLIGRVAELEELQRMLLVEKAPLVTLIGMGGVGKTRLAEHFVRAFVQAWPGGARRVDYQAVNTADEACLLLARALAIDLGAEAAPLRLAHGIEGRGPCLIVLDCVDRVQAATKQLLRDWLTLAPQAQFLVTSRARLGLAEERTLVLGGLDPESARLLFASRARSFGSPLGPAAEDEPDLAGLLDLLDHLPLAIELAASRARVLSTKQLARRMDERFRLLTSGPGTPGRQSTLQATLDWSWELLDPRERAMLLQLSVFVGGFTLEALESVIEIGDGWSLDGLQALVDSSWVVRTASERFQLPFSVLAYARERLRGTPKSALPFDALELRARHAAFFARFGEAEQINRLRSRAGSEALTCLADDGANLREALTNAVERGQLDLAALLALAIWLVIELRGPYAVGQGALEQVWPLALPTALRTRVGLALAEAYRLSGQLGAADQVLAVLEAQGHLDPSTAAKVTLQRARARPQQHVEALQHLLLEIDPSELRCRAEAHAVLATAAWQVGDLERVRAHLEQASVLYQGLEDEIARGVVLGNLGAICISLGRYLEAKSFLEEARRIAHLAGDHSALATLAGDFGQMYRVQGSFQQANAELELSLKLHKRLGRRRHQGLSHSRLGTLAKDCGETDRALDHLQQAVAMFQALGETRLEGVALVNLSTVLLEAEQPSLAGDPLRSALRCLQAVGFRAGEGAAWANLATVEARSGRHPEAADAVSRAVALCAGGDPQVEAQVACVHCEVSRRAGRLDEARALLDQARASAKALGLGPLSALGRAIRREEEALGGAAPLRG